MSKKPLTISLVIPVYNEESHLGACLRSALAQAVPFTEIIVIDNNSTDDTARIAAGFNGVRVLREQRQGVVFARNRGFDAAKGEIIARIDADTRLPVDWTTNLAMIFAETNIAAVSGRMCYYDMAATDFFEQVDLYFRRYFARTLGREVALQGSNMGVRRSAWHEVRNGLCESSGIHEDFDLAIHANQAGHSVSFDERLVASIGYRQAASDFRSFCHYAYLSPATYLKHGVKSGRRMYPVMALAIICYLPLKLLHEGHDPLTSKFSWQTLFRSARSEMRVNPATYVD